MDEQTPTYSWFERPMVRLVTIISIYLLGVLAVYIFQFRAGFISLSILPMIFFLLPIGWIEGIFQVYPADRYAVVNRAP